MDNNNLTNKNQTEIFKPKTLCDTCADFISNYVDIPKIFPSILIRNRLELINIFHNYDKGYFNRRSNTNALFDIINKKAMGTVFIYINKDGKYYGFFPFTLAKVRIQKRINDFLLKTDDSLYCLFPKLRNQTKKFINNIIKLYDFNINGASINTQISLDELLFDKYRCEKNNINKLAYKMRYITLNSLEFYDYDEIEEPKIIEIIKKTPKINFTTSLDIDDFYNQRKKENPFYKLDELVGRLNRKLMQSILKLEQRYFDNNHIFDESKINENKKIIKENKTKIIELIKNTLKEIESIN